MWPILADSSLHFLPLLPQTEYYTLEETATNTPIPSHPPPHPLKSMLTSCVCMGAQTGSSKHDKIVFAFVTV